MSAAQDLNRLKELRHKLDIIDARQGDILAFTRATMPDYEINWHHELLAKYLTRFARGEIKRLMVFMPPRHGKSELVSRRLPAMLHGLYPNDEILAASYSAELASDMTIDVQRIMDKDSYHELFPTVRITPEGKVSKYARKANEHEIMPYQDPSDRLWNYYTGSYRSAGVGGPFSGRGGNWILIDDPIKNRAQADSEVERASIKKWWSSTLRSRLEKDAAILLTHTRWHEDDLAGYLLDLAGKDKDADQWTLLILPAIKVDHDNPEDPREIGQGLWPTKYSAKDYLAIKAGGLRDWSALYQQDPYTEGGNILKFPMIKWYGGKDQPPRPRRFDEEAQSWDFAVDGKSNNDPSVGTVWGRLQAHKYLLDEYRAVTEFPGQLALIERCIKEHPNARRRFVENKANGPAIMSMLKSKVSGIVACDPKEMGGDKVARFQSVMPEFESGCIWFPDPSIAPWIMPFVKELLAFPNGKNDDRVDSTSMALIKLRGATVTVVPHAGHSGTSVKM